MTIEMSGASRKVIFQIDNLDKLTRRGIRQAFYQHGKLVQRRARQKIIRPPKNGRLYKVAGRKRRHRASAPGQAPANLTGALQKSIGFNVSTSEMELGADTPYARALELGTDKMEARPYLWPSIEETEDDLIHFSEIAIKAEHNKL